MVYTISKLDKRIRGNVYLTASKSESNRVLLIQALCKNPFTITNLSDSQDTQILNHILKNEKSSDQKEALKKLNVEVSYYTGAGGTTIRFLTAFFANQPGTRILSGSKRMNQRPIKPLVDALISLGANIQYLDQEGCPPIKIIGTKLIGNEVEVDANISSQFITALLLIAPTLQKGVTIHLKGTVVSTSYIVMTLRILEHFNIHYTWQNNTISIPHQTFQAKDYLVESDWSSASYWYEMAALADEAEIKIVGLQKKSLQGDAVLPDLFRFLGVQTAYHNDGIALTKVDQHGESFAMDFSDCPDIAQTLAVVVGVKKMYGLFNGLQTLKVKETDRVEALKNELNKIGVTITKHGDATIEITAADEKQEIQSVEFETYHDHRMALSFAPLALIYPEIKIIDPDVIRKSYPEYWNELKNMGFTIVEG